MRSRVGAVEDREDVDRTRRRRSGDGVVRGCASHSPTLLFPQLQLARNARQSLRLSSDGGLPQAVLRTGVTMIDRCVMCVC
jgi:hypothetical protein